MSIDINGSDAEFSITENEKPKLRKRSERKAIPYPDPEFIKTDSKIFQIEYHENLSLISRSLLNSFDNKYIYYAIDDILYALRSNPIERDNLLAVLYSPIISLQNNFSVNFFDIWIDDISINEISKPNKFLKEESENQEKVTFIRLKLSYKTKVPPKKQELYW